MSKTGIRGRSKRTTLVADAIHWAVHNHASKGTVEGTMMSGVTDVLSTFSASQLRDLALAMNSRGVEIPTQGLTRERLLAELEGKASDQSLSLFAHRIEAITPYKHLFVYLLDVQFTFVNAKKHIQAAFPKLFNEVREIEPQLYELEAQACVADDLQHRIYLKLVHQVQMSGWVVVSPTEKKLKKYRRRHPVVVTFRPLDRLLTIGFPGFTYVQGMQHEERMAYSEIAARGAEFLKQKLKIECQPFNAKPAIDALLEEEPNEVTDIKRSVRPKKGGRFAFDAGEENKLTTSLTEFLKLEGDIPVSETQIRSLLRRSGASDIVLVWKSLQILTRVALFSAAPEFLFIWRESGPSSSVVDTVLNKLTRYGNLVGKPGLDALRKELAESPLDQVVRVPLIAQHHSISQSDALQILNAAVAKGEFQPRFRINTENTLMEFSNIWRASLRDFPPAVTDDNGNVLDLKVPANIEVAFQRVK
jgi:hypothetical protein